MATEVTVETRPTDVGLKRELGLIGATWASETSIIGSGWLFGALYAAQAVGGAARDRVHRAELGVAQGQDDDDDPGDDPGQDGRSSYRHRRD